MQVRVPLHSSKLGWTEGKVKHALLRYWHVGSDSLRLKLPYEGETGLQHLSETQYCTILDMGPAKILPIWSVAAAPACPLAFTGFGALAVPMEKWTPSA